MRILVGAALVSCLASRPGAAEQWPGFRAYYAGRIGGAPVQMALVFNPEEEQGSIAGHYYYDSVGVPLQLSGTLADDRLSLDEKESDVVTGRFEGTFSTRDVDVLLRWTSADGRRSLAARLSRIATQQTVMHEDPRGLILEATYPRFEEARAIHRAVQAALDRLVREMLDTYRAGFAEALREDYVGIGWHVDWHADIVYHSPALISILTTYQDYTGGAHCNTGARGRTFALLDGKPVELGLRDLFNAKSNWLSVVSAACVEDLRQQGASDVKDQGKTHFTARELSKYTLAPNGLTIYFDPYEVGCYAEGPYEVVIPWKRVARCLSPQARQALPFAALAHTTRSHARSETSRVSR